VLVGEVNDQAMDYCRHRARVGQRRLGIRRANLERPERRMQPQLPTTTA